MRTEHNKKRVITEIRIPIGPNEKTMVERRVKGGNVKDVLFLESGSSQFGEFIVIMEELTSAVVDRERWSFSVLRSGDETKDDRMEHLLSASIGIDENTGSEILGHLYLTKHQ